MSYYVTHENSVLNINNAHLKVSGNVMTDVLKLGAMEFAPPASDVPGTVNFTNVTTGVTTTSNLNVGGTLMLGSVELVTSTSALEQTVNLGNTTSNTVQFTNATTGIVATGNVETQGKFIGDGSLLTGITTIESNVDLVRNTNNTAFINLNSNVVTEFPRSKKLIKYPRVVLTANGLNQGYTVSGSNEYSAGLTYYGAFTPPTSSNNPSGAWLTPTSGTTGYSTSTGEYLLSAQLHSASLTGEYVQIVLPERINPVYFTVQPRPESANNNQGLISCINEGEIWASDDSGTTWTPVGTIQNFTPTGLYQEYIVDNFNVPGYYDTFALIIHKNNGQTFAGVGEWKIFGVPEYDPDADGVDVVVKSVPNVPNTDWLEVYYDAKDLVDGAVTSVDDLTPSGTNDGTATNVTVSDGAFVFNGTSSLLESTTTITNSTGDIPHAFSLWVKPSDSDLDDTNNHYLIVYGTELNTGKWSGISISNKRFASVIHASVVRFGPEVRVGEWYHIVLNYKSGGIHNSERFDFFINGSQIDTTALSTAGSQAGSATLNLSSPAKLVLGGLFAGVERSSSTIANSRLFNRALTSGEIYQLYAYQKEYFGHGNLSMTLKAGRLGIGTSKPEAVLDVRGDINVQGTITTFRHPYEPSYSLTTISPDIWAIAGESTARIGGGAISYTSGVSIKYHNGVPMWFFGSRDENVDILNTINHTTNTWSVAIAIAKKPESQGTLFNQITNNENNTDVNHRIYWGGNFSGDEFDPSGNGWNTGHSDVTTAIPDESVIYVKKTGTGGSQVYVYVNGGLIGQATSAETYSGSTPTKIRLGQRTRYSGYSEQTPLYMGIAAIAAWDSTFNVADMSKYITYQSLTAN